MSITTKTGDGGYTTVAGGRVKKNSKLLEAIGTLDELQAVISLQLRVDSSEEIQKDLYEIMGEIGWNKTVDNLQLRVKSLEEEINNLEKKLKPLTKFLIFKKEKARKLNWVRTVARRAERKVVALRNYQLSIINYQFILIYLNRLSDYFYLLARQAEEE